MLVQWTLDSLVVGNDISSGHSPGLGLGFYDEPPSRLCIIILREMWSRYKRKPIKAGIVFVDLDG